MCSPSWSVQYYIMDCTGKEKVGNWRWGIFLLLFRALALKQYLLIWINVMLQKLTLSIKKKWQRYSWKTVPMASKSTGKPSSFQAKFMYLLSPSTQQVTFYIANILFLLDMHSTLLIRPIHLVSIKRQEESLRGYYTLPGFLTTSCN